MKLILIYAFILLSSCGQKSKPVDKQIFVEDSTMINNAGRIPEDTEMVRLTIDTFIIMKNCDSLTRIVDSIRDKLFLSNYKVERVRYYLNITLRNPSQDKFLKGWIKRAIN